MANYQKIAVSRPVTAQKNLKKSLIKVVASLWVDEYMTHEHQNQQQPPPATTKPTRVSVGVAPTRG
jgi:hypothetical protein